MSDAALPAPPRRLTLPRLPTLVWFAVIWLGLMLFVALTAEWISPFPYTALDLRNRLSPPVGFGGSWLHPLGTDELGRDVLHRFPLARRLGVALAADQLRQRLEAGPLVEAMDEVGGVHGLSSGMAVLAGSAGTASSRRRV